MALSTLKELKEALVLLRESEKDRQKILDRQIRKRGAKKKTSQDGEISEDEEENLFGPAGDEKKKDDKKSEKPPEEEEGGDEPADDKSGDEKSDDDETPADTDKEKGSDKLAGADELNDIPQQVPSSLKGNDFVDRINKIRAGASVKDDDVRNRIVDYVSRLTSNEQNDLYVHLDSLARIILGGVDAAEVITPTMIAKNTSSEKQSDQKVAPAKKKQEPAQASGPVVVVKEGIKKQYVEVPIVLRSGRTVSYGHKSHIKDCEDLISHLLNYKTCQIRGSADEAHIAAAIKVLRRQLIHALRKVGGNESKTTMDMIDVSNAPAIVEGE